jgi:hypothetical protein
MIRPTRLRDPRRLLRNAGWRLLRFLLSNEGVCMRYRPEDDYIRGPGLKWRQKHGLDRSMGSRALHRKRFRPRAGVLVV